jgi:hypothetical protein
MQIFVLQTKDSVLLPASNTHYPSVPGHQFLFLALACSFVPRVTTQPRIIFGRMDVAHRTSVTGYVDIQLPASPGSHMSKYVINPQERRGCSRSAHTVADFPSHVETRVSKQLNPQVRE